MTNDELDAYWCDLDLEDDNEFYACLYKQDREEKEAFLAANPDFVPDGDFWDSHSCRLFADSFGCCQWCGAVVFGSSAYRDLYGGE